MVEKQMPADLVERMVRHFRAIADKYKHVKEGAGNFNEELREVRAIVALLPEPVDPDLIEARNFFIESCGGIDADNKSVDLVQRGKHDSGLEMQAFLAAIKRGRELARTQSLPNTHGDGVPA